MTEGDRVTCPVTKNGHRCIKFPGHPGRCRFARVYRERINPK